MDTKIDPAETDGQNQTGQQDRYNICDGPAFYSLTAEIDKQTVEDDDGKGMAA